MVDGVLRARWGSIIIRLQCKFRGLAWRSETRGTTAGGTAEVGCRCLSRLSPPAETVFWKKPGAGPSGKKRGVLSGQLGPKGSENAPAFLPEGAEIGFLCCPVWQGKLLKTQIITFADR